MFQKYYTFDRSQHNECSCFHLPSRGRSQGGKTCIWRASSYRHTNRNGQESWQTTLMSYLQAFPETIDQCLKKGFVVGDCLENISICSDITNGPLAKPRAAQTENVTENKRNTQTWGQDKLASWTELFLSDGTAETVSPADQRQNPTARQKGFKLSEDLFQHEIEPSYLQGCSWLPRGRKLVLHYTAAFHFWRKYLEGSSSAM